MPRTAPTLNRIIGDGEMAELTRKFDWRSTSLGPIESWPDLLVTTVNMMLSSRHPMFLWWGPNLIQFYNDGYRPSIRADKHPSALGQRGAECWPEIMVHHRPANRSGNDPRRIHLESQSTRPHQPQRKIGRSLLDL